MEIATDDQTRSATGDLLLDMVRAAGLEPAQRFLTEGFSYLLRLSPPSPSHVRAWGSVWGLDYTFTVAFAPDALALGAARLVSTPSRRSFDRRAWLGIACY